VKRATFTLSIIAATVLAGCSLGVNGRPTPVTRALVPGETLGRVERASAGTPDSAVRTLLSVTCRDGLLGVRTNADAISAEDDCTTAIPQSTLDQLLGQPVVVTYTGERLVIENAAGLRLELPAKNAVVGAINGTP
jgi:hypothetical protein